MNKKEEKQANRIVLIIATLVVLSIGALGYFASLNTKAANTENENDTKTIYVATTTTEFISTTTSKVTTKYTPPKSGSTYNAYTGPAFKNPNIGLTVPGSYEVTATQNVYSGVPTTVSYNFYTNGVLAFTINAFTKEQWNDIRIQETKLAAAGTFNGYLGEGRYMGENRLWIYSYIPGISTPPMSTRFY